MTDNDKTAIELDAVSVEVLRELTRRVQDIDNSYRAVAEKLGQLYMCADENNGTSLTRDLDKPMRNASELDDLRQHATQQPK